MIAYVGVTKSGVRPKAAIVVYGAVIAENFAGIMIAARGMTWLPRRQS